MSVPALTPQEVIDDIYLILDALDREMVAMNFPYCAMDGTLLGAVRHGGMIPWDDDADLFVLEGDMQRLDALAARLAPYSMTVTEWWWGAKIFFTLGDAGGSPVAPPFPSVDLFPVRPEKDNLILAKPEARQRWPQEYLNRGEWDRRTRRSFGPLTLWMPCKQDEIEILDRLYGTGWNESVFQVWDHVSDRPLPKQKTALATRRPALPTIGILPARSNDRR